MRQNLSHTCYSSCEWIEYKMGLIPILAFVKSHAMAYNEVLAERICNLLDQKKIHYETKSMFGGLCFLVNDKMCAGVVSEQLMARIGPDVYETALKKEGCSVMNFTGKPMNGYVFVSSEAVDLEDHLEYWIGLCLAFNPLAKSSKKKK